MVSGASGALMPAPASSQRASMVSASGSGAAWRPASRRIAAASDRPRPARRLGRGERVGKPASFTARHSAAGNSPASASFTSFGGVSAAKSLPATSWTRLSLI